MSPKAVMGLLALSAIGGFAQEPETQTRVWAASCATCHSTHAISLGGIPSIAGVDKAQLLQKLLAFKNGTLPATVMHQHAKGYTDAELERLAEFFSRPSH